MLTYNDRDQTTQVNTEAAGYEDIDRAQRAALGTRGFLNTPLGVTRYTDPAAVTDVIREPTGQLTALRRTGSGTRYPITDALGSVIALTDPAGAKTDTFSYDPYGADTGRTGTTENPYRYAGEHRDPTGPYKIRLRYYTPELGRWTQPDPLHRSVNPINPPEASPYIYAANNPCNYTDPTGTVSMDCVVGAATFSGAIAAAMLFPTSHLIRGAFVVVGVGGNIYSYTNKLAACPPRAKSEHLYGQDTYDHVTD